jgi:hypothetical protein
LWVAADDVSREVVGRYYAKGGAHTFDVWVGKDGTEYYDEEGSAGVGVFVNYVSVETEDIDYVAFTTPSPEVIIGDKVWKQYRFLFSDVHAGWAHLSFFLRRDENVYIQSPMVNFAEVQPGALVNLEQKATHGSLSDLTPRQLEQRQELLFEQPVKMIPRDTLTDF